MTLPDIARTIAIAQHGTDAFWANYMPAAVAVSALDQAEGVALPASEFDDTVPDEDCLDPDWSKGGRVHNWRNHVPDTVQAIWHTFTPTQRRVLAAAAEYDSGNEQWE